MSAVKYGPNETWPSHEKKHWHDPLAAARQAGWTLTYVNAPHRFGIVSCPAKEHSFAVDQTAKGSETKAKEALKRIAWCNHPMGDVRDRRDESRRLLDLAARLAVEVEEGLGAAEAKRDAWAVLDRLELQLDTAASNVDAALIAAEEATWEVAMAVDDAPDPPAMEGRLDEAASALAGGESLAKSVRSSYPGVARPLLDQAKSLRAHIAELRLRLQGLQEQDRSHLG